MGKRQRRRQRERNKTKQQARQQPAPPRYLFPGPQRPLLEVHFADEVTEEDKELCFAYWRFEEPGTWSQKVAELGSSGVILRTVKTSCHASLLTLLCPQCTNPITARSRSDVTATGLWAGDLFPLQAREAAASCGTCRAAMEEQQQWEQQHQAENERRRSEERVANASAWLSRYADAPPPKGPGTVQEMLTLLTMIDVMERKDASSFGPLAKLNYNLGTSHSSDVEVIKSLHQQRWIAPTLPATTGNFAFDDDDTVRGVYVEEVPWRLAHVLGEAPEARRVAADAARRYLLEHADELKQITLELDAVTAVMYLDDLLVRKYDEEPVPEHRMQEAFDTYRDGLAAGFSLGQMLAITWSSTASSVAWGQRTPGLRPGSVGAASVTNLGRRLGWANDRPVPEYELPHAVTAPASRATVLRLLEQHEAEGETLRLLRSLQQRIATREMEAFEFESDLAEAEESPNGPGPVEDTEAETPASPITCALLTAEGELIFPQDDSVVWDEHFASLTQAQLVRLPETPAVHARIIEAPSRGGAGASPIGGEMLHLLGCHGGLLTGPVFFYATAASGAGLCSLDDEQQEMLRAAHRVAHSRATAGSR